MKNAVLTGSTGGIGRAVADALEQADYRVIAIKSRMEDFTGLESELSHIVGNGSIDVLITCAGFGIFRPHEEIPPADIRRMVEVNLTAPMMIARHCLRSLKASEGHIINISSVEATRHAKFSALYTATKAGLRDFSLALFEEVRRSGVKVTSINPGITDTGFYDVLPFGPADDPATFLRAEAVADAVISALQADGAVTDLTIRPRKAGIGRKRLGHRV